jgi:hypothetical protein
MTNLTRTYIRLHVSKAYKACEQNRSHIFLYRAGYHNSMIRFEKKGGRVITVQQFSRFRSFVIFFIFQAEYWDGRLVS